MLAQTGGRRFAAQRDWQNGSVQSFPLTFTFAAAAMPGEQQDRLVLKQQLGTWSAVLGTRSHGRRHRGARWRRRLPPLAGPCSTLLGEVPFNPAPTPCWTMSCQELHASLCDLLEAFCAPWTDVRAAREAYEQSCELARELARLTRDWTGEGSAGELEALSR